MNAFEREAGSAIGLRQYLEIIRRRWLIIVAITAVAVGVAAAVSFTERPTYRAQEKIVVGQGNSLFPTTAANAIQPFSQTFGDLLKSNIVAERVIRQLGLAESPDDVLAATHVAINPQTAVLTVSVDDHSKARARAIARAIGNVFAMLVRERFGTRPTPGPAGAVSPPLTVTVFDPAHVEPARVSPKPTRNLVIAAVLGVLLGLLGAFLREHFDRGLRTATAVEEALGLPVIGQIPFEHGRRREHRHVAWEGAGDIAEAYRSLRANLQYLTIRRPLRSVLITSSSPEQGKTTVTANLAVAIARSGASTLAVECDLRRPRLDHAFDLDGRGGPGLTSVLVGARELEDAVLTIPFPGEAEGGVEADHVSFLPSGPLPPNPSELLSSLQMQELIDRLAIGYDAVIIDSPPLLAVADALELARMVDGVILVARRNRTTRDDAREIRTLIERLKINLVGIVFTDVERRSGYGAYGDHGQHRGRDRGRRAERRRAALAAPAEDEF